MEKELSELVENLNQELDVLLGVLQGAGRLITEEFQGPLEQSIDAALGYQYWRVKGLVDRLIDCVGRK